MGFLGSRGEGGREEKKGVPPGEIPPIYLLTNNPAILVCRFDFASKFSFRKVNFISRSCFCIFRVCFDSF